MIKSTAGPGLIQARKRMAMGQLPSGAADACNYSEDHGGKPIPAGQELSALITSETPQPAGPRG